MHVYQLQEWEDAWCEAHWDHSEPDGGEGNGEGVKWGTLEHNDEDDGTEVDEDVEDKVQLLRCCGMARPRGKNLSVVVKPAVDREKGFVTVHDYLTVVHPWLMGLREEILAAMGTLNMEDEPLGRRRD